MSLMLTPKLLDAFGLAAQLFADKARKVSGDPYVAHLYGVRLLVSQYSQDEATLIAALLHDVIEDIPASVYSADDMTQQFGDMVTELVQTVSHPVGSSWRAGRETYLQQIQSGTISACLISAADLTYNLSDTLFNSAQNPGLTAQAFQNNVTDRRWFHEQRIQILTKRLGDDHELIKNLKDLQAAVLQLGI